MSLPAKIPDTTAYAAALNYAQFSIETGKISIEERYLRQRIQFWTLGLGLPVSFFVKHQFFTKQVSLERRKNFVWRLGNIYTPFFGATFVFFMISSEFFLRGLFYFQDSLVGSNMRFIVHKANPNAFRLRVFERLKLRLPQTPLFNFPFLKLSKNEELENPENNE